jgi:ABC-type transporter Mla subunit MlaD
MDLENVLHTAPHAIANAYNMFDPRTGAASGVFVLSNLANPVWFICGWSARSEMSPHRNPPTSASSISDPGYAF